MVGDNGDVRPPRPDEKWRGGIAGGGASGGSSGGEPVKQVTLVLDGVFFLDGEFVGVNREKLYEQTVADAQAHMAVARIARDGHDNGRSPDQILADIEKATGPAPERPQPFPAFRKSDVALEEFRHWALQNIASSLAMMRKAPAFTPERTVYMIMGWADTALPNFRKG